MSGNGQRPVSPDTDSERRGNERRHVGDRRGVMVRPVDGVRAPTYP